MGVSSGKHAVGCCFWLLPELPQLHYIICMQGNCIQGHTKVTVLATPTRCAHEAHKKRPYLEYEFIAGLGLERTGLQ